MKLNECQIQKSKFILSKLEDNNKVYSLNEYDLMSLMEKYELLNEDFLVDLDKL